MPLSEFDIINEYFSKLTPYDESIETGIGDDAAVINTPAGKQLVICTDTLNSGVHFPEQTCASDIAYKALAVNLSDLASMAATPAWFCLNLSLPSIDAQWLTQFAASLAELANRYNVMLIGGDTTSGPLGVTITAGGYVECGKGLTRSGAQADDKVYVSGYIGDAAIALMQNENNNDETTVYLQQRLNRPEPRIALGLALIDIATTCIDISDGLIADLQHIAQASQCGMAIQEQHIPLSPQYLSCSEKQGAGLQPALTGGDDYELAFTVPVQKQPLLEKQCEQLDIVVTCIGGVVEGDNVTIFDAEQNTVTYQETGYEHFR